MEALRMDPTEKIAFDHIFSRGHQNIVYEPNGNIVPDFLVEERIAVEVRRLNQNEQGRDTPKGLEEVEMPLIGKLNKFLKSLEPTRDSGWWVLFRFKRPVPQWKHVESKMREFFLSLEKMPKRDKVRFPVGTNIDVELWQKNNSLEKTFELGTFDDLDQGGFVIPELERNLRMCIDEKTKKVAGFRAQYPEWWLILVDHVAYGMSQYDRKIFRESVFIQHDWDKVTIINPLDHTCFFDL